MEHVVEIVDNFADADQADRDYWWSRTIAERLHHLQELRALNYGRDRSTGRLQRVLEIAERT